MDLLYQCAALRKAVHTATIAKLYFNVKVSAKLQNNNAYLMVCESSGTLDFFKDLPLVIEIDETSMIFQLCRPATNPGKNPLFSFDLHIPNLVGAAHGRGLPASFAVRAAGIRTMVYQVAVAIGLGWADAGDLHLRVESGGQQRLQRQAACDVVALKVPLAEAASVDYINLRWPMVVQSMHARAHRPSSVQVADHRAASAASHGRGLAPVSKASAVRVTGLPLSPALSRFRPRAPRQAEPEDAEDF